MATLKDLLVTGNSRIIGPISISDAISGASLNISGNATISGTLTAKASSAAYADSAGSANAVAWSNVSSKPALFIDAGSNPTLGTGGAITQPGGSAVVSIRTTTGQSKDVGIIYLSEDNCYIANSGDNAYVFGVFDTDLTTTMSADYASFVVLQSGNGCKAKGTITSAGFIGDDGYIIAASSWGTDYWTDDNNNKHPWYGLDHRYGNTGVYSTVLTDYYGLLLKTGSGTLSMTNGGEVVVGGSGSPSYRFDVDGNVRNRNKTYIGTGGVYIQYNATSQALEFNV